MFIPIPVYCKLHLFNAIPKQLHRALLNDCIFVRLIFLCNPMNALSDYTQILMYIISYIALRKTILAEMQSPL